MRVENNVPEVGEVFPLCPVGATLLQHGSQAGHHLAQQVIAGNTDTTEKSNLKTDRYNVSENDIREGVNEETM